MIELINSFYIYLREEKKIKSEKKLRDYYQYVYRFLIEYIPEEFPELIHSIVEIDQEPVDDYLRYWLFDSGSINYQSDLDSAGLALRHFFKFLQSTDRISAEKLKSLQSVTRKENLINIFDFPVNVEEETGEAEFTLENLSPESGELFFKNSNLWQYREKLISEKLSEISEIPPFIKLLKYFLQCVEKGVFDQRDMLQGDFYIDTKFTDLLKKTNFLPYHNSTEFFRSLVWLCEEMGLIMFGKRNWIVLEDGMDIVKANYEKIWLEVLYGIHELFLIFTSLGIHEGVDKNKAGDFQKFISQIQKMPTNMWVKINPNYPAYSKNQLTPLAASLAKLIDYSENQPLYYLCQACSWTGLIDIEFSEGKVIKIIKSAVGSIFFDVFGIAETGEY